MFEVSKNRTKSILSINHLANICGYFLILRWTIIVILSQTMDIIAVTRIVERLLRGLGVVMLGLARLDGKRMKKTVESLVLNMRKANM